MLEQKHGDSYCLWREQLICEFLNMATLDIKMLFLIIITEMIRELKLEIIFPDLIAVDYHSFFNCLENKFKSF